MKFQWCSIVAVALLASACGGGGPDVGTGTTPLPEPARNQSPGGVWSNPYGAAVLHFYVTERGDFRMQGFFLHDEKHWLVGGAGMLAVSNENRVIGNFVAEASWEYNDEFVEPRTLSCELQGTLWERQSMIMTIECSGRDVVWGERVEFSYVGISYEHQPSSLDTIASNYTRRSRPDTNTLNINADGAIFGMYNNGPKCIVNGQVSLIDARFNQYWMEWLFSSCTHPVPRYEGAEFSGVARVAPSTVVNAPEGSIFILISGMTEEGFRVLSMSYDPV